jgi:hypothetical protein
MKASFRKTKLGYVPVVIMADKLRYTIKTEYPLKRLAIERADQWIADLKTNLQS